MIQLDMYDWIFFGASVLVLVLFAGWIRERFIFWRSQRRPMPVQTDSVQPVDPEKSAWWKQLLKWLGLSVALVAIGAASYYFSETTSDQVLFLAFLVGVGVLAIDLRRSDFKKIGLFGKLASVVAFTIIVGVLVFDRNRAPERYDDFTDWANGLFEESDIVQDSSERTGPSWQIINVPATGSIDVPIGYRYACRAIDSSRVRVEKIGFKTSRFLYRLSSITGKSETAEFLIASSKKVASEIQPGC